MKNALVPRPRENFWQKSREWFFKTPERALEEAYQAAWKIKAIEQEHFDGQKVSEQLGRYSKNALDCFQRDVEKYLNSIRIKLAEFKISRLVLRDSNYTFLEKIQFIDEILNKYQSRDPDLLTVSASRSTPKTITAKVSKNSSPDNFDLIDVEPIYQKQGALPRSIGRTIHKIKTQIDPKSEEKLVQNFRNSRRSTRQALRFILLLIFLPILTQTLSKQFITLPLVEHFRSADSAPIFINEELKEEAIESLQKFEEELKFENHFRRVSAISPEQIEEEMNAKASEIAAEFKHKGSEAISNSFADLIGLFAFTGVVFIDRKGGSAAKSFLNEVIYGLSDSAKAFILILFTDMFVGFHSPHGWEVLLESFASHLGLPANHSAIFLFIATFPVILDTIFKYWIFRYLNQISPSAVATLKNMNE